MEGEIARPAYKGLRAGVLQQGAGKSISGRTFFCSWSGGKDSCIALYHAVHQGGVPIGLFTMLREDGHRSRSHGLSKGFLEQQAEQLNLPIRFNSASWDGYEKAFLETLHEFQLEGGPKQAFSAISIRMHIGNGVDGCAGQMK